mmetsp:Transcript_16468/g.41706  ORF Transcript_16468/g.41706 Transcript_16468/m.41706 type:complete len:138 (+) Transcript_16468:744-1157(+)
MHFAYSYLLYMYIRALMHITHVCVYVTVIVRHLSAYARPSSDLPLFFHSIPSFLLFASPILLSYSSTFYPCSHTLYHTHMHKCARHCTQTCKHPPVRICMCEDTRAKKGRQQWKKKGKEAQLCVIIITIIEKLQKKQ